MGEWGLFGITVVTITGFVFVLFLLMRRQEPPPLLRESAGDTVEYTERPAPFSALAETVSRGLPGDERDRREILPELTRAGMYDRAALAEYRSIRAALLFLPLFFAAALCLVLPPAQVPYAAGFGVMLAVAGFAVPRAYVRVKAEARMREIERGLPVFADMVSIALLAGQGLIVALQRVTAQLQPTFPRLAGELGIVIRHTELYSLSLAVEGWAKRSQSPDVRNLSLILTQAEKLGNDISAGLMEYSTNMRSEARQRLDERTQRATFWMLFPTIFFLWIPAAVLLVAPILNEFALRRQKAKEMINAMPQNSKIGNMLKGQPKDR